MTELPPGFVLDTQETAQIPEGFQLDEPGMVERGVDMANQWVNLGLSFMQGRTAGIGPKVMSAIGAVPAKLALETGESLNNLFGGDFESPPYKDLYETGVRGYQGKVAQSYEDNPVLSPIAEIAGGVKTGLQLGKTQLGKGIDNWRNATPMANRATGPLTQKALRLLEKSGRSGVLGEAGYRTYKVGTAEPGQEMQELTSGPPIGAGVGLAAPLMGSAIGAAGRALTPQADEALKPVAQLAQKYNIPVSVDQVTSSKPLKTAQKVSQELPFSGYGNFRDKQMASFNRAITKTFGQESDRITPEVMDKAFKDVGKKFDQFGRGKQFDLSVFKSQLDEILADADAYSEEAVTALKKQADIIFKEAKDGKISGEKLSHQRGRINALARKANDFDKQSVFRDLENAVIETVTQGDEAAKAGLQEAKKQYKNLLVVEPLARKAKGGNISPPQLSTRVGKIYGRQYTTGNAGEIGDLARIGNELLPELGGSDTFQKTAFGLGATYFEPVTVGGSLAANRAMQKWVNQNPKLVEKIIQDEFLKQLQAPPSIPAIGSTTGVLTK